jgi:cholesterol oxidase
MGRVFDAIVVGSGFGGAVTACRLAEAGASVLVLERGRRWTKAEYPRRPTDAWLFDPGRPEKHNGWLDLRFYKRMAVAQGAGVGGGSLCYSSVVMEADAERFAQGWPPEVTHAELGPHYAQVRAMLAVRPIPPTQHTQRYKLMQEAARRAGLVDRFSSVPLALSFDPDWNYGLVDPLNEKHSKPFTNAQGQQQGTCVHLGNCDIGCEVRAKNTLDLNYIARAEQCGAEVRPLHLVRSIRPDGSGYRLLFDRIESGRLIPGEERGERVVLAAGSLGTTELLLRCRDEHHTLPQISRQLGQGWSCNANVLTPDKYPSSTKVEQSIGPTISGGLDFMDGSAEGARFYIEDDGFPSLMLNAVRAKLRTGALSLLGSALHFHLARRVGEPNPLGNVMMWLGEGVDAADGTLYLGRHWLRPWQKELKLAWDVARSHRVIDAILAAHRRLSTAGGGSLRVPLYWTLLRSLVTVHPLGGCRMGRSAADGVVNHRGEIFGYSNLFVADGSVLPVPIGRNPSMTIAAIAERLAQLMTDRRST